MLSLFLCFVAFIGRLLPLLEILSDVESNPDGDDDQLYLTHLYLQNLAKVTLLSFLFLSILKVVLLINFSTVTFWLLLLQLNVNSVL